MVLRRDLFAAAARERTNTAEFLALIAEFDALRLYVPEGYASMHAFCVGELRMCEESAFKRIQAARAGGGFRSCSMPWPKGGSTSRRSSSSLPI